MPRKSTLIAAAAVCLAVAMPVPSTRAAQGPPRRHPNIVLIVTDDQGYGDLGVHANPAVRTPNLDRLHGESVRLTDFHVDPTCSPTRAALMTGKYSLRAGVWHTIMGRSLMPAEHVTLAERLRDAGYSTAIFGKWHLGDNYPFRPQDQGFGHSVIHGGGGVGQTPDHWGNTQKDDTYFVDGEPRPFRGWSTDVWFDQASKFIAENKDRPFFAYIATNAPHAPYRAPERLVRANLARGLPPALARFYAMIQGIDERVGGLRRELVRHGIDRDTILVFMTDNGSSLREEQATGRPATPGWKYNAGMREYKGTVYEGGHRVPFFIHWPGGRLGAPRDVAGLTAHIDVAPTLLTLAGVRPGPAEFDGISLAGRLRGQAGPPPRTLVVTNQRVDIPSAGRPAAVMTDRWRLVMQDGNLELHDMAADPGQRRDVADRHPRVVEELRAAYLRWWTKVAPTDPAKDRPRIVVGSPRENPSRLSAMDWMEARSEGEVPWFPGFQRPGDEVFPPSWLGRESQFKPLPWYLAAAGEGAYRIKAFVHDREAATPIGRKFAIFEVNGVTRAVPVSGLASWSELDVRLSAGPFDLKLWFANDAAGKSDVLPAFFAYVEKLGSRTPAARASGPVTSRSRGDRTSTT